MTSRQPPPLRAAIFASGGGSNFQALVDHARAAGADAPWAPSLLVTDRECGAEARAARMGVATRRIPVAGRPPDEVAAEIERSLDEAGVEAVFLAGYLRLVPPPVVQRWSGRILNIHPALLPSFGGPGMWGRHLHAAVLESGVRVSGATVHLVDEAYDRGQILAQWPVAVQDDDTADSLAARILAVEHRLYPRVADHLCDAVREGGTPAPLSLAAGHFGPAPVPGI